VSNNEIWDTPWKVQNEFRRLISYPRVRLIFVWHGISWGLGWRIYGLPIIQKHRGSRMIFGPGLGLRSFVRSNPLGPNHPVILTTWREESCLEVGANFAMTGGVICASRRIIIGNNVTVGANSVIIDTDFHPISPEDRRLNPNDGKTADVIIEDDVFIGMNCLILKGVTIGRGSLIGAGSVVTKNVPPGMIVTGNPAQPVRAV
jgi:acetyltransferase-like isoleucine patch superfamily enzyme